MERDRMIDDDLKPCPFCGGPVELRDEMHKRLNDMILKERGIE